MKKMMLAAWLVIAGSIMSGCEDPTKNEWDFQNLSSHTVTVIPDKDQDWSGFILETEESKTVKIRESTIYFNYSPSNKVIDDTSSKGKVFFLNR